MMSDAEAERVTMHLVWEKSFHTTCPRDLAFAYLADLERHPEWSTALARMEKISDGDARGIGKKYLTWERHDFAPEGSFKRRLADAVTRTRCEVRELDPGHRMVLVAKPVPSFGGSAILTFELTDSEHGTQVRQHIVEHYPRPVALIMRTFMNITEEGIVTSFDSTNDRLKLAIDQQGKDEDARTTATDS
jgi:uncharacterized protein YndB with AHSA1/START domain